MWRKPKGNYRSKRLSQINYYYMKYKQKYACKVSGDKRNAFTFKGGDIYWILNFKNKRVKKFRTLETDRELS